MIQDELLVKLNDAWQMRRDKTQESLQMAKALCQEAEANLSYEAWAFALMLLGLHQVYLGKFKEGLDLTERAFKMPGMLEKSLLVARLYNVVGFSYIGLGDYGKALSALKSGLEYGKFANDHEILGYLYYNIAEVYKSALRVYDRALDYYLEALVSCKMSDHVMCGAMLSSAAECKFKLGAIAEAIKDAGDALVIAERLGDQVTLGLTHQMLATLYTSVGKFDEAQTCIDKSKDLRVHHKDEFGLLNLWVLQGKVHLAHKAFDAALGCGLKALDLANNLQTTAVNDDIYLLLAKASEALNEYQVANDYYKAYIEASQKIVNEEIKHRISAFETEKMLIEANKNTEIERLKAIEIRRRSDTLKLLNDIGQYIVQSLDLKVIIDQFKPRMTALNQTMTLKYRGPASRVNHANAWHLILEQVLDNALTHSLYDKLGGRVVIDVEVNDTLHMTTKNNGYPIDPAILKDMYTPFVTTTKARGNLGLGLYIVHYMVTSLMGGKITYFEADQEMGFDLVVGLGG